MLVSEIDRGVAGHPSRRFLAVAAVCVLGACFQVACNDKETVVGATAQATLEARSASTATGTATFSEKTDGVEIVVEVSNVTPGQHGLHLHETGDCSAPDATSAGLHFNPTGVAHDGTGPGPHHAGDLGNITVGSDGRGRLTLTTKDLTVAAGTLSVVGKAIVLHALQDDLVSQPTGASGARIACGVVR